MIALALLFLAVAVATLVIGLLNEPIAWIWASIASSGLAILTLGVGILRGKPVQPATAGAPYGPPVGTAGARGGTAAATAASTAPSRTTTSRRPATPSAPTAPARKPAAKKAATRKPAAKKTTAKKSAARKSTAKTAAKKTSAATTSTRATVVAIPERGTYHTAECRYVKGRKDTERISSSTAKSRGFKACGVCKP